jgi:hypothetical protein
MMKSCVVFVARLSEDDINRMLENFEYFEDVINSNHLKNSSNIFVFDKT